MQLRSLGYNDEPRDSEISSKVGAVDSFGTPKVKRPLTLTQFINIGRSLLQNTEVHERLHAYVDVDHLLWAGRASPAQPVSWEELEQLIHPVLRDNLEQIRDVWNDYEVACDVLEPNWRRR